MRNFIILVLAIFYSAIVNANVAVVNNCARGCWNGLYVGAELGHAWNNLSWQYQNNNYFNMAGSQVLGTDFSLNQHAWIGGVDIGVIYQQGPWAYGLEGNVFKGHISQNRQSPFFPLHDYSSEMDWFMTAKLRLGYTYGPFLFTLNGGWAGGNLYLKLNDTAFNVVAKNDKWSQGYTIGAGVDYMMMPNVSIGLAYNYVRLTLNDKDLNCPQCATTSFSAPIVDGRIRTQTITARLNYYFYPV